MAKLYAELSSDKGGRTVSKGGNEHITISVKDGNRNMFDITFKQGEYIDIMRYSDAKNTRVHYIDDTLPM